MEGSHFIPYLLFPLYHALAMLVDYLSNVETLIVQMLRVLGYHGMDQIDFLLVKNLEKQCALSDALTDFVCSIPPTETLGVIREFRRLEKRWERSIWLVVRHTMGKLPLRLEMGLNTRADDTLRIYRDCWSLAWVHSLGIDCIT